MWAERITRIFLWIFCLLVVLALVIGLGGLFAVRALIEPPSDEFGAVKDEALQADRTAESLAAAGEPYFAAMDKGLLLKPAEGAGYPPQITEVAGITGLDPEAVRQAAIRGQNMWIAWTGGNDRFWDWAARNAIGSFDLLKIISSHPSQGYGRGNRFRYLGLSNEPCFSAPKGPDAGHFGLWIDQRDPACPPDPLADAAKYPGVAIGARGKTVPLGSYYGEPTGVLGLRLFPNPDFDAAAKARWDPERFYEDPGYYNDKDLVRPYRVGMSCAFCHVGPSPVHPPKDVENPGLADLASNPGAQYFWVDRIFFWNTRPREDPAVAAPNEDNFLYQLFHTNPPGALDTSLVSTDYMNNPRTMNAVYETIARLGLAPHAGIETLTGGELDNRQFHEFEETKALASFFDPATGKAASMRVLKDGADSVGTLGALNRVYLNIGLFSEEWLLHFRAFIGGRKISPIPIATARKNSVYWQATEAGTPDMVIFFLVTARADRLKDAPGGSDILAKDDPAEVTRGATVFADHCAACHSSKQPAPDPASGVDADSCAGGGAGPGYRDCWDRYWAWTQSDGYKRAMRALVAAPDFLDHNFLSTDRRVPLDLMGTNACSAIATNGLKGDIWDNFTSTTYKALPLPEPVAVHNPVSGVATEFTPLGNGRGYTRPASLVALWSTAPYLQNNSLGYDPGLYHYDRPAAGYGAEVPEASPPRPYAAPEPAAAPLADAWGPRACPSADPYDPTMPCVENRLYAFDRSIRQLLDPATRRRDPLTTEPVPGYIYRASAASCLMVPPGYVPDALRPFTGLAHWLAPWAVTAEGGIAVGPFPKDFPINALVNTKLLPDNDEPGMMGHLWQLAEAGPSLLGAVKALGGQCSPAELRDPGVERHAEEVVRESGLVDTLVGLSKCPDYVVNRGHDFGAALSPEERAALITYLRRF